MSSATEASPSFPNLVQSFFAVHLTQHRQVSPQTVSAYRDALMLFLNYAAEHHFISPASMKISDMTPQLILQFLDYLEKYRGNSVRSRNARLAALRSFLKFAAHRDLSSLHSIELALGVPVKRFERSMIGYLSRDEMLAVIGQQGNSWISQRDHLLLTLLYNTGARVSEIVNVKVGDVVLDGSACVHLRGKGRKQRSVPLWHSTVKTTRAWIKRNCQLTPLSTLLPNNQGLAMTRDNVAKRLQKAVKEASIGCPSLANQTISPHTLRHTTAMHLLQSGVDMSLIALWLGHENPTTTHHYVEADLAMKDRALQRVPEPPLMQGRYRAPDQLLEFLKGL